MQLFVTLLKYSYAVLLYYAVLTTMHTYTMASTPNAEQQPSYFTRLPFVVMTQIMSYLSIGECRSFSMLTRSYQEELSYREHEIVRLVSRTFEHPHKLFSMMVDCHTVMIGDALVNYFIPNYTEDDGILYFMVPMHSSAIAGMTYVLQECGVRWNTLLSRVMPNDSSSTVGTLTISWREAVSIHTRHRTEINTDLVYDMHIRTLGEEAIKVTTPPCRIVNAEYDDDDSWLIFESIANLIGPQLDHGNMDDDDTFIRTVSLSGGNTIEIKVVPDEELIRPCEIRPKDAYSGNELLTLVGHVRRGSSTKEVHMIIHTSDTDNSYKSHMMHIGMCSRQCFMTGTGAFHMWYKQTCESVDAICYGHTSYNHSTSTCFCKYSSVVRRNSIDNYPPRFYATCSDMCKYIKLDTIPADKHIYINYAMEYVDRCISSLTWSYLYDNRLMVLHNDRMNNTHCYDALESNISASKYAVYRASDEVLCTNGICHIPDDKVITAIGMNIILRAGLYANYSNNLKYSMLLTT